VTTPTTTWNTTTINGKQFLVVDVASFRIPLDWDPSSNMLIAIGAPIGGYGNIPALLQGPPGPTITLDDEINLTLLEATDPTPDSATLTLLGGSTYQVNLTIHKAPAGAPGTSALDPTVYGTPVSKKMLIVNSTADGFVYAAQLCGDRYVPSTINNTPAGNPLYTLCSVSIPAQLFDWRPAVRGQAIITATGSYNCTTDLIARLNNESAGNIVGRSFGLGGVSKQHGVLSAGPPAGSADTYDRVYAGNAAVVYLRAERQSGTDTFTTTAAQTSFSVRVDPIPGTGT